MSSVNASAFGPVMALYPGNPMSPEESLITLPPRLRTGPDGLIAGCTNLYPYSARKPRYPPGSFFSTSGRPPCALSQVAEPRAQCTTSPMKSAAALFCSFGFLASLASGECWPKTSGTSGSVFSSSVFAPATVPKLQPARVYGTQGAGAILPLGPTIVGVWSPTGLPARPVLKSTIGSVQ